MIATAAPPAQRSRWYERFPRALPVCIFLLTSAITALSVYAIETTETERRAAQRATAAQTVSSALERRINAHAAYLRSGAALFATQDEVPATLFQSFIAQLRLDSNFRGAEGIGWAMRVDRAEIADVEAVRTRQDSRPFEIHPLPAPDQAYAVPVTFLQPETERNRRALGYNMFVEPKRRAAMQEAERYARPTATGKVVLLQEAAGEEAPGFLIYMPVYGPSRATGRTLRGFIYSPFNAQDFLESAIAGERPDKVGVRLYDGTRAPDNLLAEIPVDAASGDVTVERFAVANHPWVLVIESTKPTALTNLSLVTLLFGMLVASLLLVVARLVTQQAMEDRLALEWFEEQASIRNSLTRELNHRVKNTLANVLSIVSLTRRRATDLDSFSESLEGRIRALSATHDLLTQSEWGTTPIRAVVTAEMAPYVSDTEKYLTLSGPDVQLAPNDALSVGLAIHELATNAAKYGALSVPDGGVAVTWHLITQDLARVEWVEQGGPLVGQERRRGFGMDLIEKIVAHELQNPVDLRFEASGVRCTLIIPVRMPATFTLRDKRG